MGEERKWDAKKAQELREDPRFEAGVCSRTEGNYEDAIAFFSELLKTFDDETDAEEPPLFLAPLYYNYGSTILCILERAQAAEEAAEAAEAAEAQAAASSPIPVGTKVELQGLQAKPELNSQRGVVTGFDASTGRCSVQLEDGRGPFSIKPANLAEVKMTKENGMKMKSKKNKK